MGCNAWNHPPWCDCGWGGDTGGGRGNVGAASPVRQIRVPDGLDWSETRRATLQSFVNPNARCPVCGANVFYYQSPYGGRVFFDELGPPWPKHPCTDTYVASGNRSPILPPTGHSSSSRAASRHDRWLPLIVERTEQGEAKDLIFFDRGSSGLAGALLSVPAGTFRSVPLFWRRHEPDPSLVEISGIETGAGSLGREQRLIVPSWFSSVDEASAHARGEKLSAEALNSIGWSLSFHWRDPKNPDWHHGDLVDFDRARSYFARSAEEDFWPALNNLGVMYRDGLGVEKDPELSFRYFTAAAQQMDPKPIRHLAECYRNGWGVACDLAQAQYLDDLANMRQAEIEEERQR